MQSPRGELIRRAVQADLSSQLLRLTERCGPPEGSAFPDHGLPSGASSQEVDQEVGEVTTVVITRGQGPLGTSTSTPGSVGGSRSLGDSMSTAPEMQGERTGPVRLRLRWNESVSRETTVAVVADSRPPDEQQLGSAGARRACADAVAPMPQETQAPAMATERRPVLASALDSVEASAAPGPGPSATRGRLEEASWPEVEDVDVLPGSQHGMPVPNPRVWEEALFDGLHFTPLNDSPFEAISAIARQAHSSLVERLTPRRSRAEEFGGALYGGRDEHPVTIYAGLR